MMGKTDYKDKYGWTDKKLCNFTDTKEADQKQQFNPDPVI